MANGSIPFDRMSNIDEAQSAVQSLDPTDYHLWINVGMALHWLGNDGWGIWVDWSRGSDKFDEQEAALKWRGFKQKPDGIKLDSLFHWARERGWKWDHKTPRVATSKFPPLPEPPSKTKAPPRFFRTTDECAQDAKWSVRDACSRKAAKTGGRFDKFEPVQYPYRNETGDIVLLVVRVNFYNADNKPGKGFRQYRPGDGGWWSEAESVNSRPLWDLERVLRCDNVVLVEGEKCAIALNNIFDESGAGDFLCATTSSQGASSTGKTDWSSLGGKSVTIWPDADKSGKGYADKVTSVLSVLPVPPKSVKRLPIDGIPEKHDAADWVEGLPDSLEPLDVLDRLQQLLQGAVDVPLDVQPNDDVPADESTTDESQEDDGIRVYETYSLAQLMAAQFEQEYLIDGFLVSQEPCIFAGPSKSLKTTLMLDLAVTLATGGRFLGCGFLQANRIARVGVMSGESGLPTIQETVGRICRSANISDYESVGDNLLLSPDLPKFGDSGHEKAVRKFIERNRLEVLVVDPAYLAVPIGEAAGNMFSVGELIRSISEICRDLKCMMMLLHHAKKNRAEMHEPMELGDIAWSGFDQFARQWITTNRRSKYERGTGEHHLWLGCGGSAGHSGLWGLDVSEGTRNGLLGRHWEVRVINESEAREQVEAKALGQAAKRKAAVEDAKYQRDCDAIIEFLQAKPGATKTAIRKGSGVRQTTLATVLDDLVEADQVVCERSMVRGKEAEAYWLPTQTRQLNLGVGS